MSFATMSIYISTKRLWSCSLPAGDLRTGFAELSAAVEAFAARGDVTLLGQGFGALLALHVALRVRRRLKGLVLVEPRQGKSQGPGKR